MNSFDIKMTALADGIRELSGTNTTKSLDNMECDINDVNTEINSQEDLISQILLNIENKVSNGVVLLTSNNPATASDILNSKEAMSKLSGNTTKLELLLEKVNKLSDAGDNGSSNGGNTLEMCTVMIYTSAPQNQTTFYWTDGTNNLRTITCSGKELMMDGVTLQCAKNSLIYSPQSVFYSAMSSSEGYHIVDPNCLFVMADTGFLLE